MGANYTNLPEPNVAMAKREIIGLLLVGKERLSRANGYPHDFAVLIQTFERYQRNQPGFADMYALNKQDAVFRGKDRKIVDLAMTLFIDLFMAKHPRGRGTRGNFLAALYNCCWVIKREQAAGRLRQFAYQRRMPSYEARARHHEGLKDSPIFRFDEFGMNLTGSHRGIENMIGAGEVDGYGRDVWLTEKGIRTREQALAFREGRLRRERIANHETMSEKLRAYHLKLATEATSEDEKALHTYAIEIINHYKPERS